MRGRPRNIFFERFVGGGDWPHGVCAGRGPGQELFSKGRTMKHKRPRTESLVAAAVQWAEWIMRKIVRELTAELRELCEKRIR